LAREAPEAVHVTFDLERRQLAVDDGHIDPRRGARDLQLVKDHGRSVAMEHSDPDL